MTEVGTESPLSVQGLAVRFPVGRDWLGRPTGHAHALNGIDFALERGETLGIVGESGCGKSTLAQVLTGLLKPSSGTVRFGSASSAEAAPLQIVFQDPNSSLDPRMRVWRIITEPVFLHRRVAANRGLAALERRHRDALLRSTVHTHVERVTRRSIRIDDGHR